MHPAPASESSTSDRQELSGVIVASGTEQFAITTLRREAQRPVRLVGELEGELRRLTGATVRVEGASTPSYGGDALDVRHYDVLLVDGQRPYVGEIITRGDALWLAALDTIRLTAVPEPLRAQARAKVWIIGPATPDGREVRVQSYGVIRPAQH
jgi:hypothetical protein